jgi:hypothetical protein
MPVGLAREYTSGLIDKLKNLEKNLDESVWNFKSKAAALSNVREQLAQKKYDLDSLRGSDRQPRDSYSLLGQESIYLEAEIERLEKDETAGVDAVSDSHQELGRIWDSFNDLSEECRSGLFQCSREMSRQNSHMWEIVNNLRFEILSDKIGLSDDPFDSELIRENVLSPREVLLKARDEWKIIAGDVALWTISSSVAQIPIKAYELPDFVQDIKLVREYLDKLPKGSRHYKALALTLEIVDFVLDSWEDMTEVALEKFVWTIYVKNSLRLPDGIFEKFFQKEVDAWFTLSNQFKITINAVKSIVDFFTPGTPRSIDAALDLLWEFADSYYEKVEDDMLEDRLERAVETGFKNWREAEDGPINPLLYAATKE